MQDGNLSRMWATESHSTLEPGKIARKNRGATGNPLVAGCVMKTEQLL